MGKTCMLVLKWAVYPFKWCVCFKHEPVCSMCSSLLPGIVHLLPFFMKDEWQDLLCIYCYILWAYESSALLRAINTERYRHMSTETIHCPVSLRGDQFHAPPLPPPLTLRNGRHFLWEQTFNCLPCRHVREVMRYIISSLSLTSPEWPQNQRFS